jgi:hypothetical protein
MFRKNKKIRLSENEISLLLCTLEASLDSARHSYTITSEKERIQALETQRQKAKLIQKLKEYLPDSKRS